MVKNSAVWKTISDLEPEDDKVRLMGKIVFSEKNLVVLDDSTGVVKIDVGDLEVEEEAVNLLVTGLVHQRSNGEFIIEAQTVSSLSNLDLDLYVKVYNTVKKHRSVNFE